MRKIFPLFVLALLLLTSCSSDIKVSRHLNHTPNIWPDYKGVTIPPNIAPLNFCVASHGNSACRYALIIEGAGTRLTLKTTDSKFSIRPAEWHELLSKARGSALKLTVCRKGSSGWEAFKPFTIQVAADSIDSYLAYRLIPPGYGLWYHMGIYQRNLENYNESAIVDNSTTDYNCVNCHSFPNQQADKMVFHMRAAHKGTYLVKDGQAEHIDREGMPPLVYPYWHPSEKYIAFSSNKTSQSTFINHANRIEVFDTMSDVYVYDLQHHRILKSPLTASASKFETFPTFSPDGKWLYFCSAEAVDSLPENYKKVHYNLCRIAFDARHGTFGNKVETVYDAVREGKSVSFPRISPDGRLLVFTRHAFGTFSIWHHDADLWTIDLHSGRSYPLKAANSHDTESYHSWSHNSRWMAFSSRRGNGLYTRIFITYIDRRGQAHKPFLLPQSDPAEFYRNLQYSYNIPELKRGKTPRVEF